MHSNYRLKSIIALKLSFLLALIVLGGFGFAQNVFARTVMEFFDFEDGTMQGWKFTQRDKEGISDIGTYFYGCRNAYSVLVSPDEGKGNSTGIKIGPEKEFDAYVCRVGISRSFVVSPSTDVIISFDARAKSRSPDSTVSNVQLFVYGGNEVPKNFDDTGLPYYNRYTKYENPFKRRMLFPPRYGEGDYDSGWRNYNVIVNTEGYSKITFFIATHDAWMTNWSKELYVDNVKIVYVDALYSIIVRMREIVEKLNALLIQYQSTRL